MTPLEAAYKKIDDITTPDDYLTVCKIKGLMVGYDRRWGELQKEIKLVSSEESFSAPLIHFDKDGKAAESRTWQMAGKLDKLCEWEGGHVLVDHKTTKFDVSDVTGPYFTQLEIDSQPSHYELLLEANGISLAATIWDVVRKPSIRPRKLSKKKVVEILETGEYYGEAVDAISMTHAADFGCEDGELYKFRLAYDTIANDQKYFTRVPVVRTPHQLKDYANETWELARSIGGADTLDRAYKNTGACFNYGTPCKFLGICRDIDTPDSLKWKKKPQKSAELPPGVGGASVLTNSRLRCFQTCRRKHYYEYTLGIERIDAERSEALYFGSLFHETLDAWWEAHQKAESVFQPLEEK